MTQQHHQPPPQKPRRSDALRAAIDDFRQEADDWDEDSRVSVTNHVHLEAPKSERKSLFPELTKHWAFKVGLAVAGVASGLGIRGCL